MYLFSVCVNGVCDFGKAVDVDGFTADGFGIAAGQDDLTKGSFRDMTRVARLDEDMWTELFLADADYLTGELDILIAHLTEYADTLKSGDPQRLRALLKEGRECKIKAGGN